MLITCEHIQVAKGWKPGAISKRLLRLLNQAKRRQTTIEKTKPAKKVKKRVEDKPMLIICKQNGKYIIEIQVDPEKDEVNDCSPLIYKIASANNADKINAEARKQRRLIRKAVREVWSDPFHPEACEQRCYKAYRQAIGLLPYDPNNPDCVCPEEVAEEELDSCSCEDGDVSSDCSSLDVDWEIHFSPPIACQDSESK